MTAIIERTPRTVTVRKGHYPRPCGKGRVAAALHLRQGRLRIYQRLVSARHYEAHGVAHSEFMN